jgi:hypothetical protein
MMMLDRGTTSWDQNVPPEVREAIEVVAHDLLCSDPHPPAISAAAAVDTHASWRIFLSFDEVQSGFEVEVAGRPPEWVIRDVADGFQEALIEHFRLAVPRCPVHQHPLVPVVMSGQAWWQCPQGPDVWSSFIGTLVRGT